MDSLEDAKVLARKLSAERCRDAYVYQAHDGNYIVVTDSQRKHIGTFIHRYGVWEQAK